MIEYGTKVRITTAYEVDEMYFKTGYIGVVVEPPKGQFFNFVDEREDGLYWIDFNNTDNPDVKYDGIWNAEDDQFEVIK